MKYNFCGHFRMLAAESNATEVASETFLKTRIVVFTAISLLILCIVKEISHFFAIISSTATLLYENNTKQPSFSEFMMHIVGIIPFV